MYSEWNLICNSTLKIFITLGFEIQTHVPTELLSICSATKSCKNARRDV